MRIKLRPEGENPKKDPKKGLEAHTVRYKLADLKVLIRLSEMSGIEPGVWMREAVSALAEAFERDGEVTIPFVMVSRTKAEKAGLVPAIKDSTSTSEQNPLKQSN